MTDVSTEKPILRLPAMQLERVPVVISDQEYQAYRWGGCMPRTAEAEVLDAFASIQRDKKGRITSHSTYCAALNRIVLAMVPGLSYGEVDLLEEQAVNELLRYLGFQEQDGPEGEESR